MRGTGVELAAPSPGIIALRAPDAVQQLDELTLDAGNGPAGAEA